MPVLNLTHYAVEHLRPSEKQTTYWDTTLPGFGLRTSPGGTQTWIVMVGRERRRIKIGNYPLISIATARTEAKKLLAAITLGQHTPRHWPISALSSLFIEHKAEKVRPRTLESYTGHLNALPAWLKETHIGDVHPEDINRALAKYTPSNRHHTMVILKMLYRFAETQGFDGKNIVASFSQKVQLSRGRILTDAEVQAIWKACGDDVFGRIVRILILCGFRKNEVQHLIVKDDMATLPAAFSKNRRESIVPLPKTALPLFNEKLSFQGWSRAKKRLDIASGVKDWVLHDTRRFYSSTHASLSTPIHITERLLNHASGQISGVAAVYNRHLYINEMRQAVDMYERHLFTIL